MFKASTTALVIGLALVPSSQGQDPAREACIQRCITKPLDPELQRQEIVSLERETAHAIQLNNGSFFNRVYSDDFAGTLSHGQQVNRAQWIDVVQSPGVKYESFNASDIKVRIYQNMAVATCLWSARSINRGQRVSSQFRTVHVYMDTPSGWRVISGQTTNLPPDLQQAL